jgi:hypothetical protein
MQEADLLEEAITTHGTSPTDPGIRSPIPLSEKDGMGALSFRGAMKIGMMLV